MKIVYYDSISDRLKKLKEYNDTGQTLIHDDFINRLGKPTKGDSGRLTFNIIPNPDKTKLVRKKLLQSKLKDNSITFEQLKEYLRN